MNSKKLFKVLGAIPDGLIIMDGKGSLIFINQAAREILHLKDTLPSFYLLLSQKLSFDPLSINRETKKDLFINDTYYHLIISPFHDDNRHNGVVIFLRDISIWKEAQNIKSDFVSIASHELRTPITAVKTALEILISMCGAESSSKQEKLLKTAVRNVDRIAVLISQYLDITKIGKGRTAFLFKKLNLVQLIDSIAGELNERSEGNKTAVQVDLPPDLPYVLADPHRLEQVFFNLLENAMKFAEKGNVTISAKVVNTPVENKMKKAGPMMLVTVADNGPEIPESKRKLIFDKFYRLKKPMEKEGVGLGLSIVKELVELHGGQIYVEPNKPAGNCFCFTLPVFSEEKRDPGFRWVFDRQFQKARENQCVLSLLAVIIENLQEVEAQIGKKKTNIIIKSMEDTVKGSLYRQTDIAVQRREKEMFVVFCDAEKEGAHSICKRINKNIANVLKNQYEKQSMVFKISIGLATYPNDSDNQRDLFRIALNSARGKQIGEKENFNS